MPYKDIADRRAASRRHYAANREAVIARAKDHNIRNRLLLREFIRQAKDVPCTDCSVRYPYYVMQFDHLNGKTFTIGMLSNRSLSAVEAEIAKCEVVCANCHAERTHVRRSSGGGQI